MLKKIIGYVVVGLIVIAVLILVRLFLTNGYPENGSGTTSNTQTPATNTPLQTESPTSAKISLTITSPLNGTTLGTTNAVIKGKTTPGADVFVNDQTGIADANGNFSISIGLDEGVNQLVVSANDTEGNATQQSLSITVVSFQ